MFLWFLDLNQHISGLLMIECTSYVICLLLSMCMIFMDFIYVSLSPSTQINLNS